MEEALDELNEEFFRLSAQVLELQKKDGKLDQLPLGEENTSLVSPASEHLGSSSVTGGAYSIRAPCTEMGYDQST